MIKEDVSSKTKSSGGGYSEETLRDLFTQYGLSSELTDKVIKDYQRYKGNKEDLSTLTANEVIEIVSETLPDKLNRIREIGYDPIFEDYVIYMKRKKDIVETYQESRSWDKVITTVVYCDEKESQVAFVDYVEEINQTKVKDAKHLQSLTGITEETLEGLEETVTSSRYSKYFKALRVALVEGAKYEDLLQIKPQAYNLPETWSGSLSSDQYSSILWAISFEFLIDEPASLMLLPDLRSIAKELEAPYSVLMDCYKLRNSYGVVRNKEEDLIESLKRAIRSYVKKQPKEWRDNHLFNKRDNWTLEDAQKAEDNYINFYSIYFKIILYSEVTPDLPLSDMEKKIIEVHREDIIENYKPYLDRGIKIYRDHKERAKIANRKILLNLSFLP
jgi:hypothetical protein